MLKKLQLLFIITFLVQACTHEKESEQQSLKKTDLSKAASFNVQLAIGYLKQGDRPRAKKKLLTALSQEPLSADVHSAMGYYFEQIGEIDNAEKYYFKAMSLGRNGGAQLNNYGAFLCRQGHYKKAETYFLQAVNDLKYLYTAGAYENAGLCALSVPNEESAKIYFTKALNQDSSRKVSLHELLKLEIKSGHDDVAFSLTQKHPDLIMNDKVLLSLAKEIADKVGQHNIAAEYQLSMNNLNPNINRVE